MAFLAFYVAYVVYLVLDGTGHARADEFGRALLASIPLLILAASAVALRGRHTDVLATVD